MRASHTSKAERSEFGNRIATSKGALRFKTRAVPNTDLSGIGNTSSTSGINFQTGAILSGAAIVICASGRPALIARTAGTAMTLSPNQLGERMTMRNGFSDSLGGTKIPRL